MPALLSAAPDAPETPPPGAGTWYTSSPGGEPRLRLYFFWSDLCPHCQHARGFVETLERRHDWLTVESHNVRVDRQGARLYRDLAASLGAQATSVPGFLFCGRMMVGYDSAASMGRLLEQALLECHAQGPPSAAPGAPAPPEAPGPVAGIDPARLSLPLLALVLGGLDAFNPCAFFVLLVLLSLLVHTRSRARMALVGSVFVISSGLVYFLMMAAWLNVFLVLGNLRAVTLAAGALAVVMALLNVKDYVVLGRGPTLSMAPESRRGLFQRMRGLLNARSLSALLPATLLLAVVANLYEALCTAGLPMVFTRALTLHDLPTGAYYGYLALYNLVYVLPLGAIVTLFVLTLGSRHLSERAERLLKLLSGLMMLGLGLMLLAAPALLSDLRAVLAALAGAVAITAVAGWLERLLAGRAAPR